MPHTTKKAIVLSNQDLAANPAHQEAAAVSLARVNQSCSSPNTPLGPRESETVSELRRLQTQSSGLPL